MIMYVHRNTNDDDEIDTKGQLSGVARSAFWASSGLPVFFSEAEVDRFYDSDPEFIERPTPGMVGMALRRDKTFVVAADGEAYRIDIGWPTLQSYAKAVETAADLERRLERMLKEFLTEEAAVGLIRYVATIAKFGDGTDVTDKAARKTFEEFKAWKDA
jgi:hypothetical protein